MLSKKALQILEALVAKESNVQMAIGLADEILEIRKWTKEELEKKEIEKKEKN